MHQSINQSVKQSNKSEQTTNNKQRTTNNKQQTTNEYKQTINRRMNNWHPVSDSTANMKSKKPSPPRLGKFRMVDPVSSTCQKCRMVDPVSSRKCRMIILLAKKSLVGTQEAMKRHGLNWTEVDLVLMNGTRWTLLVLPYSGWAAKHCLAPNRAGLS